MEPTPNTTSFVKSLSARSSGASLVEYAAVAGLVSVVAIAAVLSTGDRIQGNFSSAQESIALEYNGVSPPQGPIDPWAGTDTTGWLIGTPAADTLNLAGEPGVMGLESNDIIAGTSAAEIFIGGLGADTINSGPGSDTIKFALGDGNDTVNDYGNPASPDIFEFVDAASTDFTFSRTAPDNVTMTSNVGDVISMPNVTDGNTWAHIENFTFTDVTFDHQAFRNRVVSDMKSTGTVIGTYYPENYQHTPGDGSYTIQDYGNPGSGLDTLEFSSSNSSDFTFGRSNGQQIVATHILGDVITLPNGADGNSWYHIEAFVFDDQTYDHQQIRNRVVSDMKSTGTVIGSYFSEDYKHTPGDGSYTLNEYGNPSSPDSFEFVGSASTDYTFGRTNTQQVIATHILGDVINMTQVADGNTWRHLESFIFTDTTYNHQQLRNRVVADMKATGTVIGSYYSENYYHATSDPDFSVSEYGNPSSPDVFEFTDSASTSYTKTISGQDVILTNGTNTITFSRLNDGNSWRWIESFVFTDATLTRGDIMSLPDT